MLIAQSLWRNTAEAAAAIVQLSRVRDAIRVLFPPASLFVGCCLLASRRRSVGSSRQQLLRHPEEKKGLEDFFKLRNP